MKKEGAGFDVPVAAAVSAAFEMISPQVVSRVMMAGEIGLDGESMGYPESCRLCCVQKVVWAVVFCVVPAENLERRKTDQGMQAGSRSKKIYGNWSSVF